MRTGGLLAIENFSRRFIPPVREVREIRCARDEGAPFGYLARGDRREDVGGYLTQRVVARAHRHASVPVPRMVRERRGSLGAVGDVASIAIAGGEIGDGVGAG